MIARSAHGYFALGNKGGPGRPPAPVEQRYLRAITKGCPPAKLMRIVEKLAESALDGDTVAAGILLKVALPDNERIRQLRAQQEEAENLRVSGPDGRERVTLQMLARFCQIVAHIAPTAGKLVWQLMSDVPEEEAIARVRDFMAGHTDAAAQRELAMLDAAQEASKARRAGNAITAETPPEAPADPPVPPPAPADLDAAIEKQRAENKARRARQRRDIE